MTRSRLQTTPIEPVDAWPDAVAPSTGAVTLYVGTVRGDDEGHPVDVLVVEAYAEMAVQELDRLCEQTIERFGLEDARVVHRIGRVEAGEALLAVAIHGRHRKETFAAIDFFLDELKRRVPIWKKEDGPAGRWIVGEREPEAVA